MIKFLKEEQTLYQILDVIKDGYLTVVNHRGEEFTFGKQGTYPNLRLVIHKPETYKRLLTFASLGFGESYVEGWWDEENDNLAELVGLLLKEGAYENAYGNLSLVLNIFFHRLLHLPTLIQNSRKNVKHHYDLGNDFYKLFLDKTLTYSCGYQVKDTDTLEEMQLQKYELICKKLLLKPEDKIIDIGCGWGGMLIYAAEKYGVSGTGITLSQKQAELAREYIEQRGLSKHLKVLVSDYREVEGQYDKFVSIGMCEHVGKESLPIFMKKVSELLKPNGIGLLHTIGTVGRGGRDPWLEKYIFPGAYLPKLHELTRDMQASYFLVAHCENLKLHYAKTLKLWSDNFRQNKEKIMALPQEFDQRFIRMWDLYLQVCEATFRYGNSQLYQILFCKGKQWQFDTPLNFQIEKPSAEILRKSL